MSLSLNQVEIKFEKIGNYVENHSKMFLDDSVVRRGAPGAWFVVRTPVRAMSTSSKLPAEIINVN